MQAKSTHAELSVFNFMCLLFSSNKYRPAYESKDIFRISKNIWFIRGAFVYLSNKQNCELFKEKFILIWLVFSWRRLILSSAIFHGLKRLNQRCQHFPCDNNLIFPFITCLTVNPIPSKFSMHFFLIWGQFICSINRCEFFFPPRLNTLVVGQIRKARHRKTEPAENKQGKKGKKLWST